MIGSLDRPKTSAAEAEGQLLKSIRIGRLFGRLQSFSVPHLYSIQFNKLIQRVFKFELQILMGLTLVKIRLPYFAFDLSQVTRITSNNQVIRIQEIARRLYCTTIYG